MVRSPDIVPPDAICSSVVVIKAIIFS